MGKGRKPKPAALRLLTGRRANPCIPKHSPMPPAEIPPTPVTLSGESLEQWNLLVPLLSATKVLTAIDAAALEMACLAFGDYREARRKMIEHGKTQFGKGEVEVKSPWVTMAHEALADYAKFSALLGLSPADRARLQVTPQSKQVDEFEEFQKQA